MVDYSNKARNQISKVSATDLPISLLEITHVDLATPERFVNDRQDVTFEGNVYKALAFNVSLPSDLSSGTPRAQLGIDNVDKGLVEWLEASNGGAGTQVRIVQILRSIPTVAEFDMTMTFSNIVVTNLLITGQLGFEDLLNTPAVTMKYNRFNSPGLFD